jgi:hypothetical protein
VEVGRGHWGWWSPVRRDTRRWWHHVTAPGGGGIRRWWRGTFGYGGWATVASGARAASDWPTRRRWLGAGWGSARQLVDEEATGQARRWRQRSGSQGGGGLSEEAAPAAGRVRRRWAGRGGGISSKEVAVCAQETWRWEKMGRAQLKNWRRDMAVSKPTYICQLTDEYRWARTVSLASHIFISDATSTINIGHVYSSVTWRYRWIYGSGQSQIGWLIYSSVAEPNRRI